MGVLDMNIPAEMVSLVGGGVMGLIVRMVNAHFDRKAAQDQALNARLDSQVRERDNIRGVANKGFQWTRRTIALSVVAAYVGPKFWALLYGDPRLPIAYCYYQSKSLIANLFAASPALTCTELPIIAVTPLDQHLLAAVIGLYFGASQGISKR